MESLNKRADQADELLKKLVDRITALESKRSSGPVGVGIHKEVKQKIRTEVLSLRAELKKAHDENKALAAENQKLKKSAKAGGVSSEFKKKTDENWDEAMRKAQKLRGFVQALEAENQSLKSEIEGLKNSGGSIKTDKLTQEQLEWLKNKMNKVRSDMVEYMNKKDSIVADVKAVAAPCAGGKVKMTMETIQDLKYYTITTDLQELKKEREECELGELDDEDLQPYLGRKVRVIEIEEDDDTVNVRFDNHDSQWFPVGCMYMDAPAAPAAPANLNGDLQKQSMDTIKERKTYFITKDMAELKKEWQEAELGDLDDEDFQSYLGREVKTIDIEEDDDTVNVRFDNHDSQWFPVTSLYQKVEGGAKAAVVVKPKAVAVAVPALEKMTLETFKERKKYTITNDLTMLKKEWYEAELGELDDEDFKNYLGREVYAFDTEEDDETANVRFDNHDSQWFPIGCLYRPLQASVNGSKKKQSMDTIKERKTYFITKDLAELKKEWYDAELGELDDEDFKAYLGREVKTIDIEEDDDTVNVRFDNHDSQWFPVTSLYQ